MVRQLNEECDVCKQLSCARKIVVFFVGGGTMTTLSSRPYSGFMVGREARESHGFGVGIIQIGCYQGSTSSTCGPMDKA